MKVLTTDPTNAELLNLYIRHSDGKPIEQKDASRIKSLYSTLDGDGMLEDMLVMTTLMQNDKMAEWIKSGEMKVEVGKRILDKAKGFGAKLKEDPGGEFLIDLTKRMYITKSDYEKLAIHEFAAKGSAEMKAKDPGVSTLELAVRLQVAHTKYSILFVMIACGWDNFNKVADLVMSDKCQPRLSRIVLTVCPSLAQIVKLAKRGMPKHYLDTLIEATQTKTDVPSSSPLSFSLNDAAWDSEEDEKEESKKQLPFSSTLPLKKQ